MNPLRFIVSARTDQQAGRSFPVAVSVVRADGSPARDFRGEVQFGSTDAAAGLPASAGFDGREGGRKVFAATLNSPGVQRITVADGSGEVRGETQPLLVRSSAPMLRLFWGDLHGHSGAPVLGPTAVDHFHLAARDELRLDFCALTEPDVRPATDYAVEDLWEQLQRAVRYFHAPGEFVPFLGYEWTGATASAAEGAPPPGHRQVLFLDDREQPFSSRRPDSDTLRKLHLCLAGKDALTIAHHPAAPPPWTVDWDAHEPEFDQLVEIYSSWGSSESPDEPEDGFPLRRPPGVPADPDGFVQAALARGYRLGFTAGSDSWGGVPDHLPATAFSADAAKPYPAGLTGVYATELTREALWDALLLGRTYATTGARMVVEFSLNEELMGMEVDLLDDDLVRLRGRVLGTADLSVVEVVKNNRVLRRYPGAGRELEFNLAEEGDVESGDYYYLRAVQQDGHRAWSSPVWIG